MDKDQILEFWNSLKTQYSFLTATESLDFQIRRALQNCIYAVSPVTPLVFPYDVLEHDPAKWANIFTQNGIAEGWVIKRCDLSGEELRANSARMKYGYDVWGFRDFSPDSEENNSDLKFSRVADDLFFLINKMPTLGISCGVLQHEQLSFKSMTTLKAGVGQMHWNPGKIIVELCDR